MTVDVAGPAHSARGAWLRALERTAPFGRDRTAILPRIMDSLSERFADQTALIDDTVCVSYRELSAGAHRYARWALQQGIAAGDVVCLLVGNCADYVAMWLGLTRIGAVAALVNTNLQGTSLAHAVFSVRARGIIVGADQAPAFGAIRANLGAGVMCWAHGGPIDGLARADIMALAHGADALAEDDCAWPVAGDHALMIYTSGTTGLPKAAYVSHRRVVQWVFWFAGMMDTGPADRMYNCLPMYHSIGGIVAVGALLVAGGSVVIRPRFSATQFWSEIVRWDCTLFQYIGELCRYLVNTPPHPLETRHRLRLCCGNGLRADVWPLFKQRFRIPHILEYYAATEGTFSLYNCEEEPGAIGRIPAFLAVRSPVSLIRLTDDESTPRRGADGLCVLCGVDEVGEAVGRIDGSDAGEYRFEGYLDADASRRKILRDVLRPGDSWFRTGDLMRRDKRGFYYFVDRIGDTYRWKGENVSSQEVSDALSRCPGVEHAVAYGVALPGTEGRAGMAALVTNGAFDADAMRSHLARHVPDYARPVFIRICSGIETTTTFRPRRQTLQDEGFDPRRTADPILFHDRTLDAYCRVDEALFRRIQAMDIRV